MAMAANAHPMTRVDEATRRSRASVPPNMAMATTRDRGVIRSRSIAGSPDTGAYSTDVALPGPVPPGRPDDEHAPAVLLPSAPEQPVDRLVLPGDPEAVEPAAPIVTRTVDLDWRSVLVILVAFVGLVALTGFLRSVPHTTTAVSIAVIIALAMNPLIERASARLHVPRSAGVAVTMLLLGALLAVVASLVIPPAIRQARDLSHEVPHVTRQLANLPIIGARLEKANAPAKLQRSIEGLPQRLAGDTAPLERGIRHVADGLLAGLLTMLFAVTLMLDGPRLVQSVRRLVPVERQRRADDLGRLAYRVVGRYVAGSLMVALVAGLVVLGAGLGLGVPLTPLAAVWALLWDLVPQIGGAAGGIPFVLLGLTKGAGTAVVCAIVFVVYQQLKHQVLQPVLIGQAVKLSPPTTMLAALVGVSAGGVVGALIAVPLVGAAKAMYLELRHPPPVAQPPEA